jgi:hypothetical protein
MSVVLDFKKEKERIRDLYKSSPQTKKGHFLIIGEKGVGKTSLALTCPRPVLIHSFDPGGTEVLLDENGELPENILVDTRFERDTWQGPTAYKEWETEYRKLGRGGFFKSLGTYILDSTTTFGTSAVWQIMAKEGRTPPGMTGKVDQEKHGMRIQDWGTLLNAFLMLARSLSTLPCHTIMTGHIGQELDGVTGALVRTIVLPGQSKDQLPINTSEVYIMRVNETPRGISRHLLTQHDGRYRATTRMGRHGIFEKEETPDIRELLKKAKYPHEDVAS